MGTVHVTNVEGTINKHKYIGILENKLWPVVARHLPNQNFLFQDYKVPIHWARDDEGYKASNNINSISWPAESLGLIFF